MGTHASRKIMAELSASSEEFERKARKRGVVYIARIPPGITPSLMRKKLEDHARIGRIYLVPEDETRRKRRISSGGRGRRRFVEGWAEFENKYRARDVAEALNATRFAGRKGDPHYDDLWSLKFLKHFKWEHLTEKMAYEASVREQRVRAQVAAGRRESAAFLENVEKAKRVAHGMKKREKQGIAKEGEAADTSTKKDAGTFGAHKRRIRQHQPMQEALDDRKAPSSTLLGAVLGAGEGRKRKRSSSRDSGNERNKK